MNKTVIILALLALLVASGCSKMERNEKKYLKGIQSENYEESNNALNDFCKWLQTDKKTMSYDFALMKERMGMKVVTSPDSLLKCYSWKTVETENSEAYACVMQWMAGDRFIAYRGPLDDLLARRQATIKNQTSLAHSIDTIYEIRTGNIPVYLISQSYTSNKGKRRAYITAAFFNGLSPQVMPFFFDGVDIAGNSEFKVQPGITTGDLFKWDEKSNRLYVYQTDDKNRLITGEYIVYQLDSNRLKRLADQ